MACQVQAWLLSTLSRSKWLVQYGACSVLTQSAASWGEFTKWMKAKSIKIRVQRREEHPNGQLPERAESTA
jgi:hypothetical protein